MNGAEDGAGGAELLRRNRGELARLNVALLGNCRAVLSPPFAGTARGISWGGRCWWGSSFPKEWTGKVLLVL